MPDRKKTLKEFDRITSALVDALILLQDQPDVVFCKDCKKGEPSDYDKNFIDCPYFESVRDPDWFCADGKRKDES